RWPAACGSAPAARSSAARSPWPARRLWSKVRNSPHHPPSKADHGGRGGASMRWIVVASAVLVTAAGCSSGADETAVEQPDRGTIGIAMPTTKSARWVGDGKSIEQQFQLLGYKTDLQYAEDDVDKQISQIKGMIDGGEKA